MKPKHGKGDRDEAQKTGFVPWVPKDNKVRQTQRPFFKQFEKNTPKQNALINIYAHNMSSDRSVLLGLRLL